MESRHKFLEARDSGKENHSMKEKQMYVKIG